MLDQVAALAGHKPAMLVSQSMLSAMILYSMRSAYNTFNGRSVPTFSSGVEARLVSISVPLQSVAASLVDNGAGIKLALDRPFDIEISLHLVNQQIQEFSRVTLALSAVAFPLSERGGHLITTTPDATIVGNVTPHANRAAALATAGAPSVKDVERIEGALAFLIAPRVVAAALGTMAPISLRELYPNLVWSGDLEMHVELPYLVLIPEDGHIAAQTGCPTEKAAPNWSIESGAPAAANGANGPEVSVPLHVTNPPQNARDGTSQGNPIIGLYLPQSVLDQKFKDIYPAVEFKHQDDAFLGTYTSGVVGLEGVRVDVDPARLGLSIGLDVHLSGKAEVNVDVPCTGRMPVAFTTKLKIDPTTAQAFVGVKLTWSKLSLVSYLEQVNIGAITIYVVLIPTWLLFAGGAGLVTAFFIDRVADRIVAWNARIAVQNAIEDASNKGNFDLIDFHKYFPWLSRDLEPTTAAGANYIVYGVSIRG
jgi:hypothetical protein